MGADPVFVAYKWGKALVFIQFQLLVVSKILSIFSADIWRKGMKNR